MREQWLEEKEGVTGWVRKGVLRNLEMLLARGGSHGGGGHNLGLSIEPRRMKDGPPKEKSSDNTFLAIKFLTFHFALTESNFQDKLTQIEAS